MHDSMLKGRLNVRMDAYFVGFGMFIVWVFKSVVLGLSLSYELRKLLSLLIFFGV